VPEGCRRVFKELPSPRSRNCPPRRQLALPPVELTLFQPALRLWQGRFFDRALRTVKEYQETVEYIHWNPLRWGLLKRPEDWKWSSAHEYTFPAAPGGSAPAALAD
jgi:putative transposase